MQTPPPATSHTWTEFTGYGIAILAAIPSIYTAWKNRRKPDQEVHESEARTELARAQATQTVAQTLQSISNQLREAKVAITEVEQRCDDVRYELDETKLVADRVPELEARIEAQKVANRSLTAQNERMAAQLKVAGIEFADRS